MRLRFCLARRVQCRKVAECYALAHKVGETFYVACQLCLSIFLCGLGHFLSGDVGQVIVFVIRLMIAPHHKDNLEPLGSQSPQRSMVTMSFSPLVTIVMIGPLTSIERDKGQPVGGM